MSKLIVKRTIYFNNYSDRLSRQQHPEKRLTAGYLLCTAAAGSTGLFKRHIFTFVVPFAFTLLLRPTAVLQNEPAACKCVCRLRGIWHW